MGTFMLWECCGVGNLSASTPLEYNSLRTIERSDRGEDDSVGIVDATALGNGCATCIEPASGGAGRGKVWQWTGGWERDLVCHLFVASFISCSCFHFVMSLWKLLMPRGEVKGDDVPAAGNATIGGIVVFLSSVCGKTLTDPPGRLVEPFAAMEFMSVCKKVISRGKEAKAT